MSNGQTLLVVGLVGAAAVLLFGPQLLKRAAAAAPDPRVFVPTTITLDPTGGPTRVPIGTVVPTPTPQPLFSTQVIGGDVVSNDFVPYGPDVSTVDRIDNVIDIAGDVGGFLPFAFNPFGIGPKIDAILNIF